MSQDVRDYELIQVDNRHGDAPNEADKLSVTATVGPTTDDMDATRGVQLTLSSRVGTVYGRLSEPQIRELIGVLQRRVDSEQPPEATGQDEPRKRIKANGEER